MERVSHREMSPRGCSATAAGGTRSRGLGGRQRAAVAPQSSAGLPAAPGEPACPCLPGHVRSLALEVTAFNTGKLQTRGRGTRGAAQSRGGSAVGGPRFLLPGG